MILEIIWKGKQLIKLFLKGHKYNLILIKVNFFSETVVINIEAETQADSWHMTIVIMTIWDGL